MIKKYITDQEFESTDLTSQEFEKGEYDNCTFTRCHFTGTDLRDMVFNDCVFQECDLSNCRIDNTSFRQVQFINCKMLGLHFEHCNPFLFSAGFSNCTLNFSSFYKLNLKGTFFSGSKLEEVDLTETNLENASFENCDLTNAVFDGTNLCGADLRTAVSFTIDPSRNAIRKAKFSRHNLHGLLSGTGIIIE